MFNKPFTQPTHRFKGDATDMGTVAASSSSAVYYTTTSMRCLTGGELVVWNNQEEDWIQIDVVPVGNETVVQAYCLKRWVSGMGQKLDIRPLAACVPTDLRIKVTYHSSSEVATRKFAVNLDLFEEL